MAQPKDETSASGSSPDPIPPAMVPDHQLLRLIGKGSYGEVWLGKSALGTYRAIKIVYESTFRDRRPFEREFHGVQKFEPLSRLHEGLMDILQVGRNDDAGYFYCVMELADDVDLGQAIDPDHYTPRTLARDIARQKRLPIPECRQVGAAIGAALEFLHRRGLIHRDVKPSNIVFVNGAPKLADIGLVVEMSESRSYVGTEGFIPPEGPGTTQADIYSLGKVLYEISTGKDRYDFPELPVDPGDPALEKDFMELNRIILKACRADARQRYKTAEDMLTDLLDRPSEARLILKARRMAERARAAGVGVAFIGGMAALLLTANLRSSATIPAKPPVAFPGLIGHWGAERNALDGAGTNNGTLFNGASFANGKTGRAFDFQTTNAGVKIPAHPSLNVGPGPGLTIALWINPRDLSQRGELAEYNCGATNEVVTYGVHLQILAPKEFKLGAGNLFADLHSTDGKAHWIFAPGGTLTANEFQHVALTYDKTSGMAALYRNGQILTNAYVGRFTPLTAYDLYFGCRPTGAGAHSFAGSIDQVDLYNRALSPGEIQALYNASR